ncbi:MAG TPA: transketolase [Thermoanaerobaculia bacterium]|nr:transketolase [Thermoanaerobaculia bacterium]
MPPRDTAATTADLDHLAISALRFLAVDMVEAAKSGHPGAPLGQAPMAYLLFARHLHFDPASPEWPNRDRFVLSCGHASALLYGLLHLAGYDLPMAELRRFRQLGSKTPGHPEHGLAPGVETTTGPLGQGLGNAVGMALAEQLLAHRFNREGFALFDHRVWVLASDGDLMEGVASEASSLAGHLRLGKLNVLYDSNRITIEGSTDLAFTEDVVARYRAYGWHTTEVEDGNDLDALDAAMRAAAAETARPSLILVHTHIGYGSPNKQDSEESHGAPLGAEEARATKEALGWPVEPPFLVPDQARLAFAHARDRGEAERQAWERLLKRYAAAHPELAGELARRRARALPDAFADLLPSFEPGKGMATRQASGTVLNALRDHLPELVGGSADLAGSNNTLLDGEGDFRAGEPGRNLRYGVREHAMGAAMNGMALSGLLRPYGGTFLIFSDYMRPSVRLAALMGQPAIYVFTHDSIFLGEDGPTHQPISQLQALRAIPNLVVLRPADANETAAAWAVALERTTGPTALALTRHKVPVLEGTRELAAEGVRRGAYVLRDAPEGAPAVLLLATGSEVSLAVSAHEALAERGVASRVVSMPSWELFARQDALYRESVLPRAVRKRLAIEAASPFGWHRWVGDEGDVLGVERFGASAPWEDLAKEYGFTVENVVARVEQLLA